MKNILTINDNCTSSKKQYKLILMLLLLDVCKPGVLLIVSCILLSIDRSPSIGYICVLMLYAMNETASISTGLYPILDLLTANKLHYITLPLNSMSAILNMFYCVFFSSVWEILNNILCQVCAVSSLNCWKSII